MYQRSSSACIEVTLKALVCNHACQRGQSTCIRSLARRHSFPLGFASACKARSHSACVNTLHSENAILEKHLRSPCTWTKHPSLSMRSHLMLMSLQTTRKLVRDIIVPIVYPRAIRPPKMRTGTSNVTRGDTINGSLSTYSANMRL